MNQYGEGSTMQGMGEFQETGDSESLQRKHSHNARDAFGQIKTAVSDKVRSAANSLHQTADQVSVRQEGLSSYGHQAATWLEHSADYIEDFEPQEVVSQVRQEVRKNPGRSLLIAGAAGLVLGILFRRR